MGKQYYKCSTDENFVGSVYYEGSSFSGHHIPAITNKRFWPSNIDIQNHIALAIKKQRNNNIDQEVILELLNQWKEENPGEQFYLRLKGDNNVDDISDLETTDEYIDDVRIGETYTKTLYGTDRKLIPVCASNTMAKTASQLIWE